MNGDGEHSVENGAASAGVPVVRLGAGEGARRYELDEEALRRVLLRRDARDLPAVVLSVAGAYRGGKSFILDFFLRYLKASPSSQLNGEWLGREDERLKGFHWRGGGERDTTGIHLWPEPIITTLNNGEKVAVLLMDTQGTFDSETTMGQNTTIFALSTLISSVQIYNLSGNLKEDDLQHLQLFTEYGKLASEAEGKAFQTLLFLVRDWTHAYEHEHGFAGGDELLRKRLQSNPTQKAELREVREHIRSCFDSIKCFLMPHPGLAIENQSFAGSLSDLTPKFRAALLKLVPALLAPEHLTPKLVNGERVRTQDLFEYFRKYIDIFNSDDMPPATTILSAIAGGARRGATRLDGDAIVMYYKILWMTAHRAVAPIIVTSRHASPTKSTAERGVTERQSSTGSMPNALFCMFYATTDACLLAAARAASAAYKARMKERVTGEKSLSKRALADAHAGARAEAERVYALKKKLGSKEDAKAKLEELIKELDECLLQYELKNEAMVRKSLSLASKTYDDVVSKVSGEHARLCLHPADLMELNTEARDAALTLFDSTRDRANGEEDDQRTELAESLNQKYNQLKVFNEQNNNSAVREARDLYESRMKHTGTSSNNLQAQSQQAREAALAFLAKKRNRAYHTQDDPYVRKLLEEISRCFEYFEKAHIQNNKATIQNKNNDIQPALNTYNNYIQSVWSPAGCCFHPQALLALHNKAMDEAVKILLANGADNASKESLVKMFGDYYTKILEHNNKINNERSMVTALSQYTTKMDVYTRTKLTTWGLWKFRAWGYTVGLDSQHELAKEFAIADFRSRRRGDENHLADEYLDMLKQNIEAAFQKYKNPWVFLLSGKMP